MRAMLLGYLGVVTAFLMGLLLAQDGLLRLPGPVFVAVVGFAGPLLLMTRSRARRVRRHLVRGFLPFRTGPPCRVAGVAGLLLLSLTPVWAQIPISRVTGLQAELNRLRSQVVDASRYGVRADGTTDDKAALDAAWNAAIALPSGGIVQLPKGTIYLATKWKPAEPGAGKSVWLRGQGVGTTVLKGDNTVANYSYIVHFEGSSGNPFDGNIKVSDLSVDRSNWSASAAASINTGTVAAATTTSITLGASASAADDYYNGMVIVIISDSGNAQAVQREYTISDYVGATKVASCTVPAAQVPTTAAKYGILLDGADADDQASRGVRAFGFTYCNGIWIQDIEQIGGHGCLDFRGSQNGFISGLSTSGTTENALNWLIGSDLTDANKYFTVTNFNIEAGEGLDCACDYLCVSNGTISVLGAENAGIDINTTHYATFSNITVSGGAETISVHGTTDSTKTILSGCYDIAFSNITGREFYVGGASIKFGCTSTGAEQIATAGYTNNISFTGCSFISTQTGAVGIQTSWTSTSAPSRIHDIRVVNCYAKVPGAALLDQFGKNLQVLGGTYTSTGSIAISLGNSITWFSENVLVSGTNCIAASTTSTGAINVAYGINVKLKNNTITNSGGRGIYGANVRRATITGNHIETCAREGIYCFTDTAAYTDTTWTGNSNRATFEANNNLGWTITGNEVRDWGSGTNGMQGIRVNYTPSTAAVFRGVRISDNTLFLDAVSVNSHTGITIGAANVTSLGVICEGNDIDEVVTTRVSTSGFTPTLGRTRVTRNFSNTGSRNEGVGYRTYVAFHQDNVAADQAAVELTCDAVAGAFSTTRWVSIRPGKIVGIQVKSNAARSGGTLTVEVYKNNTATGLQALLDATNTTTKSTYQMVGDSSIGSADIFAAGEELNVRITTDGSWDPTTADIQVILEVEMGGWFLLVTLSISVAVGAVRKRRLFSMDA